MIASHFRAGTGAVLVETREEARFVQSLLAEIDEVMVGGLNGKAEVLTCDAPGGPLLDANTEAPCPDAGVGLLAGYKWLSDAPNRILVVHDWHTISNSVGHWRALIRHRPRFRKPRHCEDGDFASLAVFVAPQWQLEPHNPLRGSIPILQFAPPSRADLARIADGLMDTNGEADAVADALVGLSADTAEQAAAECLAATGTWNTDHLRNARRQLLREAGLEIWPTVEEIGGLTGLRDFCTTELIPWVRDPQLSVRRLLSAGVPGVGKSYFARWLAKQLNCECARLSIPSLKGGLVGQSEGNLRRALGVLDALGAEAPLVCVVDEIDTIAREGLDGGTSSGMFAELLTWLQESRSQTVVVATLNRLDKLDAALESRFQARFFFDLPSECERQAVAEIHYARLGCTLAKQAADETAEATEGFSSREIAEHICPSVARLGNRIPDADTVLRVCRAFCPASRTQATQLEEMRRAASTLRRANDPQEEAKPTGGRRIGKAGA